MGFCEVILDCHLSDLGYEGPRFTWEHDRGIADWVKEHLDRVFVTKPWKCRFQSKVFNIPYSSSDYLPGFLNYGIIFPDKLNVIFGLKING